MRMVPRKTTGNAVVSSSTTRTRSSRPTPAARRKFPQRATSRASSPYVSVRSGPMTAVLSARPQAHGAAPAGGSGRGRRRRLARRLAAGPDLDEVDALGVGVAVGVVLRRARGAEVDRDREPAAVVGGQRGVLDGPVLPGDAD